MTASTAKFGNSAVSLDSATTSHKVLVSIGVLLVFAIIVTQIAGVSKQWATVIGLVLFGLVLQNINHALPSTNLEQDSQTLPFVP